MADVSPVIAANRDAVNELIAASERCGAAWTTPRAPGKWSPSQIVEHVARSIEESANMMAGAPTKFVALPFFLRPVARTLLFKRVLRTGGFPKARTNKAMDPQAGPATPGDARARLEGAFARFDRELHRQREWRDLYQPGPPHLVPQEQHCALSPSLIDKCGSLDRLKVQQPTRSHAPTSRFVPRCHFCAYRKSHRETKAPIRPHLRASQPNALGPNAQSTPADAASCDTCDAAPSNTRRAG